MQDISLGAVESRFADIIWANAPLPSSELLKLAEGSLGWKKSTTYTVLKKLCEKGFAKNESSVVTALVPRDKVAAFESERVVERTFGGSLPSFLAAFLGGKTISEQEAAELKKLIDSHREG